MTNNDGFTTILGKKQTPKNIQPETKTRELPSQDQTHDQESTDENTDNPQHPLPQKKPGPVSPQTESKTPEPSFPPQGFGQGHIFIRPKENASRFKIRASDGKFYNFEGTPKEGDFLRRLAPVTFRLSLLGTRVEEVSEITNPTDAMRVPPLAGILTNIHMDRGYGEVSVARIDGSYDNTPFKFFLRNLENPDSTLPKKGSRVLFRTGFSVGSRLDKGGNTVGSQRYINIVHSPTTSTRCAHTTQT